MRIASSQPARRDLVVPGLLALATIVCLAPFVGKAFCIDDPLFLWAAQWIRSHPLDCFGFEVNWYGSPSPMHEVTKNPPLAAYYIALVASVAGWSESALHTAFLLPAVGSVLGTWCLARSLCRQPVGAALATLASPVFLVSSTNVMCDTMALCLWLWALVLWKRGLDTKSNLRLLVSGLLIAASALTKYFGISLIPLIAAYTLLRGRRFAAKLLFLGVPVGILIGYHLGTEQLYGRGLLADAAEYAWFWSRESSTSPTSRLVSLLCFIGGCFLPVGFCSPWLLPKRGIAAGAVAATVVALTAPSGGIHHSADFPTPAQSIDWGLAAQTGLLAVLGLLALWVMIADFRKRRDSDAALLGLWIVGTVVFAGFVNWTCNGRSLLPMAPAIGIVIARRIEDRYFDSPSVSPRWTFSLIPALGVALAITWADYRFAESGRAGAERAIEFCRRDPRPVWFQGHWGFQYYMESRGARPLDFRHVSLQPDDWLVIPENNTNLMPLPVGAGRAAGTIQVPTCSWLATSCPPVDASFYSNAGGRLPFAFGRCPPERYDVWRILPRNAAERSPRTP